MSLGRPYRRECDNGPWIIRGGGAQFDGTRKVKVYTSVSSNGLARWAVQSSCHLGEEADAPLEASWTLRPGVRSDNS